MIESWMMDEADVQRVLGGSNRLPRRAERVLSSNGAVAVAVLRLFIETPSGPSAYHVSVFLTLH